MADKNYGLLISALVAMVAIVGLVVLLSGGSTGAVTVIRGDTSGYDFGRPLGSNSNRIVGVNEPCWYNADGEMECPQYMDTRGGTFGAPQEWREGREPTVINTASDRGYWSS